MKISRADEQDQLNTFANATIQGSDTVAFSIATYVRLPALNLGVEAMAAYLERKLGHLEGDGVSFEVQVGHATSAESHPRCPLCQEYHDENWSCDKARAHAEGSS